MNERDDVLNLEDATGLKIRAFGSVGNKSVANCGFDSIENLLPILPKLMQSKASGFSNLRIKLTSMGYMEGLTAQAMPYDWRTFYQFNKLNNKFSRIIEEMFKISGKKVIIVTHSMGGVVTWHNLLKMKQEHKDKMIESWIAIAPAFLGS